MTERSHAFMNKIWEERNAGADTEEKLVSAILQVAAETVRSYNAQDGRIVLDQKDLLELSREIVKPQKPVDQVAQDLTNPPENTL